MPRILAFGLAALGLLAQPPRYGCEPNPEVASALQAVADLRSTTAADLYGAKASALLREALARHPDDIFGNLGYVRLHLGKGNADVIVYYRARMELDSADRRYALFYAASLVGTNTPEALKRLAALASADFPYPYLIIGQIHSYPAFKDDVALTSNLAKFIRACPSYLPAYSLLREMGAGSELKGVAQALREELKRRTDRDVVAAYPILWAIEFRVAAAGDHPSLRARVANDLASLAALDPRTDPAARATLREGYRLSGNSAAVDALPPENRPAREAVFDAYSQWMKQNPRPNSGAASEETLRFDRRLARAALEWIVKWPDEPLPYNTRFLTLARMPETTNEELIAAGQALIDVNRRRPARYLSTPAILTVAGAFVDRGIQLDDVPAMIERGLSEAAVRPPSPESDLFTDSPNQRMDAEQSSGARLQAHEVRFHWAMKTGKRDVAARALAEFRRELDLRPGGARVFDQRYWRGMAELAEAEGRQDEAAAHRSAAEQAAKAPVRIAQSSSGWTRPATPLPELHAGDLNGKTWTWADLAGKTVIMNVWATWCAPCIQELPHVQKLHESGDVLVLTLNVDANPGVVAPFVKERGWTFPVLLATEFVNKLLSDEGIPRTWIVRDRTLLREQIGFGKLDNWIAEVKAQFSAESPAQSK